MIIFNMTDLHGRLSHLETVRAKIERADLLIITGDLTHFGGAKEARRIIEPLIELNRSVLAVSGNCDRPGVGEYLDDLGVHLVGRCVERGGVLFAGLDGSLPGPLPTPNTSSEKELSAALASMEIEANRPLVLVSHQPPVDSGTDIISSGRHVGSRSVREFIERRRPILCLTGHIHESVGRSEIGGCLVANPGPFRNGNYAVIELRDGRLSRLELLRA